MLNSYGAGSWKLVIRREADGIHILRAETADETAVLPDEIDGQPVVALEHHALAAGQRPTEGETLELFGAGAGTAGADNTCLRHLGLPAHLRQVGRYAFFNCRNLQSLMLADSLQEIAAGAFMNCRDLNRVVIRPSSAEHGRSLFLLANEFSGELTAELLGREGETGAKLVFPAYYEDYEENSAAHHFELNISGGGFQYRAAFREGTLNLADFDARWPVFLFAEHDEGSALRLAWYRLRYPRELSAAAELQYLTYCSAHSEELLPMILAERDLPGFRSILPLLKAERPALETALEAARRHNLTEATALLLQHLQQQGNSGRRKVFEF